MVEEVVSEEPRLLEKSRKSFLRVLMALSCEYSTIVVYRKRLNMMPIGWISGKLLWWVVMLRVGGMDANGVRKEREPDFGRNIVIRSK